MSDMSMMDLALVLALAVSTAMIALRRKNWRLWTAALLALSASALIGGLIITGVRWQMASAYCAGVILAILLIGSSRDKVRNFLASHKIVRWLGLVCLFALIGLSILFSWAFPMVRLPEPGGPFAVGGLRMELIDARRPEIHTANPLDRRALMLQIWYPAAPGGKAHARPYFQRIDVLRSAMNRDSWPLGWLIGHLGRLSTHTIPDAPVAGKQGAYPVLVFSHGLGVFAVQNTVLFEALASRGYVVVSIDHSFDNMATIFPDGKVTGFMADAYDYPERPVPKEFEARAAGLLQSEDPAAIGAISRETIRLQPEEALSNRYWLDQWSKDQRSVLDELEKLQSGARPSPFRGRLDLTQVGVMGMSMGGSAAQITCAVDARCRAGINMDGYQAVMTEVAAQKVPFLYFNGRHLSTNRQFLDRDRARSYWIKLADAEHYDFTDLPLLLPILKHLGVSGPIDPPRAQAILNGYVIAFFDRHLRNRAAPLLDAVDQPLPDVKFVAGGLAKEPSAKPLSRRARQ